MLTARVNTALFPGNLVHSLAAREGPTAHDHAQWQLFTEGKMQFQQLEVRQLKCRVRNLTTSSGSFEVFSPTLAFNQHTLTLDRDELQSLTEAMDYTMLTELASQAPFTET